MPNPDETTYSVTSSPFDEPDEPPWNYTVDGLIDWVDEVFLEGYKQDNEPMTLSECLDLLASNGYTVEQL